MGLFKNKKAVESEEKEYTPIFYKHDYENVYGVWDEESHRRTYANGCYAVPKPEGERQFDEVSALFSSDGKYFGDYQTSQITEAGHGFVCAEGSHTIPRLYHKSGEMVFGARAVICPEELGENLSLIPLVYEDLFYLYNHKTKKFIHEIDGVALKFDGMTSAENGNVIAVKPNEEYVSGWGSLRKIKKERQYYEIDLDGNIVKEWTETEEVYGR